MIRDFVCAGEGRNAVHNIVIKRIGMTAIAARIAADHVEVVGVLRLFIAYEQYDADALRLDLQETLEGEDGPATLTLFDKRVVRALREAGKCEIRGINLGLGESVLEMVQ